jgi:hypothetical protein
MSDLSRTRIKEVMSSLRPSDFEEAEEALKGLIRNCQINEESAKGAPREIFYLGAREAYEASLKLLENLSSRIMVIEYEKPGKTWTW